MRRILPAVIVVLIASLVAAHLLLLPGDYKATGDATLYSAFGLANFYFMENTGYFERDSELRPLLHMWSLGVEEQFYVVWPIVLMLLHRMFGLTARQTLLAICALLVASLIASIDWAWNDPKEGFYSPLSRAWELGVGGLMVFAPKLSSRMISEAAGIVGLLLIFGSSMVLGPADPFPGVHAIVPVVGAALLVWPRAQTTTGWVLALPPLRFIGLVSFSLYLWHWPVLVYYRIYSNTAFPSLNETIWLGLFSLLLAILTWWFIEQPFRRPWSSPRRAILTGVSAAAAVALAGGAVSAMSGFEKRFPDEVKRLGSLEEMWDWSCPGTAKLTSMESDLCTVGSPWETASRRVFLWGDSHAEHLLPMLHPIGKANDTAIAIYRSCMPIVDGKHIWMQIKRTPTYSESCGKDRARILSMLRETREIDLVVIASAWANSVLITHTESSHPPMPVKEIAAGLERLLDELQERRILLVAQFPRWSQDPVPCALSRSGVLLRETCPANLATISRAYYDQFNGPIDRIMRALSTRSNVDVLVPSDQVCTTEACLTRLNDEFLYRDTGHLRRNLSAKTTGDLGEAAGLSETLSQILREIQVVQDK